VPTYAMGVTHGDFDADGDPDLYVTALGPNRLFRNDGARGFVDASGRKVFELNDTDDDPRVSHGATAADSRTIQTPYAGGIS